jgi:small subunit ribosomal protein S12
MNGKPQRLASVVKVFTRSPKKPNSANRPLAQIVVSEGWNKRGHHRTRKMNAHIPGEDHALQIYNRVRIRGAGISDMPGIHLRVVHGPRDFKGITKRMQKRSKYATVRNLTIEYFEGKKAWEAKVVKNNSISPEYDSDGEEQIQEGSIA